MSYVEILFFVWKKFDVRMRIAISLLVIFVMSVNLKKWFKTQFAVREGGREERLTHWRGGRELVS